MELPKNSDGSWSSTFNRRIPLASSRKNPRRHRRQKRERNILLPNRNLHHHQHRTQSNILFHRPI